MTDNSTSFIPNSYQTPNAYCDRLMYLLTPAEWKVLSYAVRRIFGFQKRQDHISLSQFMHGTISRRRTDAPSEYLDRGTGLSKPAIQNALEALIRYRLIYKMADNDPRKNYGDLYALQLDYDQVDYAGLIERADSRSSADQKRTAGARNLAEAKRLAMPLPGQSDLPGQVVSGTDRGWSVGLTGDGQSDRPGVVSGTDTQYTDDKKEETNRGFYLKDFDLACSILKEKYPSDFEAAGPVLLESDEKPYRLRIQLQTLPADFQARMVEALGMVNPRRRYSIVYQIAGVTGRAAPVVVQAEAPALIDPYAPTDGHERIWFLIKNELSVDCNKETFRVKINPARVLSVNGAWTIGAPDPQWWKTHLASTVKIIYKGLTNKAADFVFVDLPK